MGKLAVILLILVLSFSLVYSVSAYTSESLSQSNRGYDRWTLTEYSRHHTKITTLTHEWSTPSYSYVLETNRDLRPGININSLSIPRSSLTLKPKIYKSNNFVAKSNSFW